MDFSDKSPPAPQMPLTGRFAPPATPGPPPAGVGGQRPFGAPPTTVTETVSPYLPGGGRAKAAVVLLGLIAGLDALGALIEVPLSKPFFDQARGEMVDESVLIGTGLVLVLYALAYFGIWVATVIAYCMWIHRAHKNLSALGARDLSYTPGWAVGWYFVPIMNLFRPFQVMAEIWKASEPRVAAAAAEGWRAARTPPLIALWWATYLLSSILGQASIRIGSEASYQTLYASTMTSVFSSLISVISAVCLIQIIRGIGVRQDLRHVQMTSPAAPVESRVAA